MGNNENSITIRKEKYEIIKVLGQGRFGRVFQVKIK